MKKMEKRENCKPGTGKIIGVLGVFPFAGVAVEKIEHGIEHLILDGYQPMFFENLEDILNFDEKKICLNWVVSASGLPIGQYLEQKGIPYFASFPVGMRAMRLWRVHLAKTLGYEDAIEIPPAKPHFDAPNVLVIGDPVLTAGIKRYLEDMQGCTQVVRAHYTPTPSIEAWYAKILTRAAGHGLQTETDEVSLTGSAAIADAQMLGELVAAADIIIGDAFLKPENMSSDKLWIDLPDNIYSLGKAAAGHYELFGKKGAAWLREKLAAK
ncbi:MAG: hypothetical protein Q4D21_05240 [Phascolarctobacterium sp.]|nr:hypothetical protein [Phascolarctobacterium sp.]